MGIGANQQLPERPSAAKCDPMGSTIRNPCGPSPLFVIVWAVQCRTPTRPLFFLLQLWLPQDGQTDSRQRVTDRKKRPEELLQGWCNHLAAAD